MLPVPSLFGLRCERKTNEIPQTIMPVPPLSILTSGARMNQFQITATILGQANFEFY